MRASVEQWVNKQAAWLAEVQHVDISPCSHALGSEVPLCADEVFGMQVADVAACVSQKGVMLRSLGGLKKGFRVDVDEFKSTLEQFVTGHISWGILEVQRRRVAWVLAVRRLRLDFNSSITPSPQPGPPYSKCPKYKRVYILGVIFYHEGLR